MMIKTLKNKYKVFVTNNPTRRFNLFVICICFALIVGLSVGYAILSEQLDINSVITLRANRDIRINSIDNFTPVNGGYEIYNPRYNVDEITTNIALPRINSTVTYTSTIVNKGNSSMKVKSITNDVFSNNDMTYTLSGLNVGQIIESDETVTFTITFKYNNGIATLPLNTTLGSVISFIFEEYIPQTYEYVSNGLILDLRGTDAPVNNIWYDRASNLAMNLTNVVHSQASQNYSFSGSNSFGTLGEPILPATGDFTLEAYITTPATFISNTDEAIVAQVSDTANDDGRFKFNFKYGTPITNSYQLITFANLTSTASPANLMFKLSPNTSTDYLLQFVRTGDTVRMFCNGIEITGLDDFTANNTISQGPFKLGKWNNVNSQYYTGSIYAVRVYNRALSTLDLENNRIVDVVFYQPEIDPTKTIREYALDNYLVSSGSGLYQSTTADRYVFKGDSPNNYLRFAGESDLYRIVSFESDNTMKIVNVSAVGESAYNKAYDNSGNRLFTTSTYCNGASEVAETINGVDILKGCNAWNQATSLTEAGSTGNVLMDASIVGELRNFYNNTLSTTTKNKIVTHDFYSGFVPLSTNYNNTLIYARDTVWNGDVGLIDLADVLEATIGTTNLTNTNTKVANYLTAYSTKYIAIWTMTGSSADTWDVWAILNGSVGQRRASRTFQPIDKNNAIYYMLPSFYIESDALAEGNGSETTPFIIQNN